MAQASPTDTTVSSIPVSTLKGAVAWPLRAAAVLTTSYVASSHMPCSSSTAVWLVLTTASVDYTSIELIVEGSIDASTWVAIPGVRGASTAVPLVLTLSGYESATSQVLGFDIPVGYGPRYLRVKAKRTGGTATGTAAITAYCGTN